MTAYYNEINPYCARWLRKMMASGLIAHGIVDETDIRDVVPSSLANYTQCHFFAGIGLWSYSLKQAGWPDDKPMWTGSCPCQPFSQAGKKNGFDDERHLWPDWNWLIQQQKPDTIFGEQVASKDGLAWLDLVQADLEKTGYTGTVIDLCAAGFGAPNIRQRLWFVAERLANPCSQRLEERTSNKRVQPKEMVPPKGQTTVSNSSPCRLANSNCPRPQPGNQTSQATRQRHTFDTKSRTGRDETTYETNGFWSNVDWLFCQDGKWRPTEPGIQPLADGNPRRVQQLRAYGNAINPEVAKTFIEAYMRSSNINPFKIPKPPTM